MFHRVDAPKLVKTRIEKKDKEYSRKIKPKSESDLRKCNNTQIWAAYKGDLSKVQHARILKTYFVDISIKVLEGHTLKTPLGSIYLKRFRQRPGMVDVKKAKDRLKSGDMTMSIQKDNDYIDMPVWDPDWSKPYLKGYSFKLCFYNEREITKFERIRSLNKVTNVALRKYFS